MYNHLRKLKEVQGDNFDMSVFEDLETDKLGEAMDVELDMGESDLLNEIARLKFELQNNAMILQQESEKKERYEKENARRKHNYIPFILEMLKIASEKGDLSTLYADAKAKAGGTSNTG